MPYIVVPQQPMYHQVSLEDILSGKETADLYRSNETNTRTFFTNRSGSSYFKRDVVDEAIASLVKFTEVHKDLYEIDRHKLYNKFYIPKHSGGLREINAPLPPLMDALRELKTILETKCFALYHTSAFAYVKNRRTVDAVKRHQDNNSNWFLKVDFHDFFGSTNKEFTIRTLETICPFNLIVRNDIGRQALEKALDLCFLDGRLPQGTPISPMLTNLLMIPVDYMLVKKLNNSVYRTNKENEKVLQHFVYTRYADDMLISSLEDFSPNEIQNVIIEVLAECRAPYTFKREKTRYGSRAGSNWNLGVMLNKDNNITVGHKAKKYFRAMLNNYILDNKRGVNWSKEDVQHFAGLNSYYNMVEPEYFSSLIASVNIKHKVDLASMIKADLNM